MGAKADRYSPSVGEVVCMASEEQYWCHCCLIGLSRAFVIFAFLHRMLCYLHVSHLEKTVKEGFMTFVVAA